MYYLKYDFLVNNELKIGEYGGNGTYDRENKSDYYII